MRALTVHRKPAAMAQAPVTAEIHQALDIHRDVAAKIAFHDIVAIDDLADLDDLRFGQLTDAPIRWNGDLGANLPGEGIANPMNIRQSHLDPLVGRDVHACDSGHVVVSSCTANVLKTKPEQSILKRTSPTADRHCPPGPVGSHFHVAGLM